MLLGVEIIQGSLEREEAVAVTGEHHHEGIVPHEYVAVVSNVQIRRNETGAFLRLADIAHRNLPGVPVHFYLLLMTFPDRRREDLFSLLEGLWSLRLGLHRTERVLRHEYVLDIRVLVRKVVGAGLQVLGYEGNGAADEERCQEKTFHFFTSLLIVRAISVLR